MSNETSSNVQVTKSFPVGKEELYKAWTEPDQLKQWWRPLNKQLTNVENDIRVDGKVIYEFGDNLQIRGTYKEVEAGEKLVYSWNWELPEDSMHKGEYLLHVSFQEDGEGSTLEITQENFKHEHAIKPHQSGWDEALEDLNNFLAGRKAS